MTPQADHGEPSYKGTGRLARLPSLSREGVDVAISYLSEETDARDTERLVTEAGRRAVLLPGDIGQRTVVETVARKAIDALGSIDLLVNNAAFQRTHEKFEDIPEDEFEEAYRVNEIQRRWRASGVFFGRV